MRRFATACALGAALLGAALVAPVAARTPDVAHPRVADSDTDAAARAQAVPISVTGCSVRELGPLQSPRLGYREPVASDVSIEYRNDRDAAATDIRFRVRYGGKTLSFDDRGTFAGHAKMSRDFTLFDTVFSGSTADCAAVAAVFADGTRWN